MKRFIVMGVSGCGKSSIGAEFAARINARFLDGDDLHSAANIEKMAAGIPLNDQDRAPWLSSVGSAFQDEELPLVIGCSALKRTYRDIIRQHAGGPVAFVHLDGTRELIAGRMAARKGHFMPDKLLDSQFAALEPPGSDEDAVRIDIDQEPEEIVSRIVEQFLD